MTLPVAALVLFAAVLHASWNAVLKSGGDRFRSIVVMTGAAGLACLPFMALMPLPLPASWPALALTSCFHFGYNLVLVRAYRSGDLGQVYPVARGSSPLLVTLGALLVAGEHPGLGTAAGILLISGGIISLARAWAAPSRSGLVMALLTGAFIAAYSVTDGVGGRLSGSPVSYSAWLFAIDGALMAALYLASRVGRRQVVFLDRETWKSAIGGVVQLAGYTAIIWAASVSPMGPVSALRETSVVFAVLIGWLFLGEVLTVRRLASCVVVALGALLLGHGD